MELHVLKDSPMKGKGLMHAFPAQMGKVNKQRKPPIRGCVKCKFKSEKGFLKLFSFQAGL